MCLGMSFIVLKKKKLSKTTIVTISVPRLSVYYKCSKNLFWHKIIMWANSYRRHYTKWFIYLLMTPYLITCTCTGKMHKLLTETQAMQLLYLYVNIISACIPVCKHYTSISACISGCKDSWSCEQPWQDLSIKGIDTKQNIKEKYNY